MLLMRSQGEQKEPVSAPPQIVETDHSGGLPLPSFIGSVHQGTVSPCLRNW